MYFGAGTAAGGNQADLHIQDFHTYDFALTAEEVAKLS
jgi:hypothetical protein